MKIKHILFLTVIAASFAFFAGKANAAEATPLTIEINSPDNSEAMKDNIYDTVASFKSGDVITVKSTTPMAGIYIKWNSPVKPWTITYNGSTESKGVNGFLHEYVKFAQTANECSITVSADAQICDIIAYSEGELPGDVQLWQPPCDNEADFIVFSTHADDEILFLGGVLASYAGQEKLNVQVVYMTNYWDGEKVREHEKLDGIWHSGVKIYPVNSTFPDIYAENLEDAMSVYSYNEILSFVSEQIRRFKPMVCVTQDLNGEYGHGGHMILAKAVCEAVDKSNDNSFMEESVKKYGAWEVPKTYLHLYEQNCITMDLRKPLSNMGNRTALEIATEAYKKHESQQWCWFYVSDDYKYSCNRFGLYKTTVGADTGNDMFEHLTSYAEIKAKQEEESRLAAEAESESIRQSEEASISEAESLSEAESISLAEADNKDGNSFGTIKILVIVAGALAVILFAIILLSKKKSKPVD